MKNVLITGANSYVGTSVEKWLLREPNSYHVETLDMKDPNWVNYDFSKFDVVFHVAGIAHVSKKKSMENLYYKVNRDLAIETALVAKENKVKQFIFMSSIIVYNSKASKISSTLKPNPDNFYGKSKFQAEEGLLNLNNLDFKVTILRPPMIYGPNSKGNFSNLLKVSKKLFLLPEIHNRKSILFIDNLSNFIEIVINKELSGIFHPRNYEIVSTNDIISTIRELNNQKNIYSKTFGFLIKFSSFFIPYFNKIYGDRYYDSDIDKITHNQKKLLNYNFITFKESVGKSIVK